MKFLSGRFRICSLYTLKVIEIKGIETLRIRPKVVTSVSSKGAETNVVFGSESVE